ncbi:MAG: hypothetical protein BECKG1743F_GA0114225_112012, partial [Candidatus Kentron sp. G]
MGVAGLELTVVFYQSPGIMANRRRYSMAHFADSIIGSGFMMILVTSFEIRGTLSHDQAWVPDGAHGR